MSLGLIKHTTYLKQTFITYKEFISRLIKIPKDIITAYISLRFVLNKAVDPPITKIYINPTVFYQKSYLATLQRILKTIIFFNTKNQAISIYKKTLEYLIQLYLIYYTKDVTSLVLIIFHQLISFKAKKLILIKFRILAKSSNI